MVSIGQRLDENRGLGPGFDTLRLLLSIAIVAIHSVPVSVGWPRSHEIWLHPAAGIFTAILPAFFALSGFLVMGSAARNAHVGKFLGLRVLRIVPALATEIAVSALLIGPALTRLSLWDYVSDPLFFRYFQSLFGRISTVLPGVFESNPVPGMVNVSLWTIPSEILCYVIMAGLLLFGLHGRRRFVLALALGSMLANLSLDLADVPALDIGNASPRLLVTSFLAGNVLYLYRYEIPFSFPAFAFATVLGLALVRTDFAVYASLWCWAYVIAYLGLCRLPRIPVLSSGDYSYGIYLYGFPIQQGLAYFFPETRVWYLNLVLALPLVVALAAASWFIVEKPALGLKSRLRFAAPVLQVSSATKALILTVLTAYGLALCQWGAVFDLRSLGALWPALALATAVAPGVIYFIAAAALARQSRAVAAARGGPALP